MEESAWELSKENIQPLKQGRQPSILSKALRISTNIPGGIPAGSDVQLADGSTNSSASLRAMILQQEKQEFENSLKTCMESPDPLAVYYRYVRWIEETHPAGKEKEIRELVNKCLTSLKDKKWFDKYANDIRYLYIWLKFASFSKNMGSHTVYEFMLANGHCVRLMGFYLQWAGELERSGHYDEAAKVFQLGIQKEAQPLPSLVTAYEEFQARFARRLMEQQKVDDGCDEDETRNVLGVLKGVSSRRTTGTAMTTPYMRHSKLEEVKCGKATNATDSCRGAIFTVYDESQENASNLKLSATKPKLAAVSIPSEKSFCKENVQDADVWTKAKITQAAFVKKSSTTSEQAKAFAVHVDDSATSSHPVAESNNRSQGKFEATSSKRFVVDGALFVCCMDEVYNGSTEKSFEELRALRWQAKRANAYSQSSISAAHAVPATTPFASRPPLAAVVDSEQSCKKVDPISWNTAGSPPGNTSFTKNIYREAMAAFSNTLHLSTMGPAAEVEDSHPGVARSSAVIPKGNAIASGFAIYEDPYENRNDEQIPKEVADKENIDPKTNPSATAIEKKRRNVAGILCPSTEFVCLDENNKNDVIIVEEDEEPASAPAGYPPSAASASSAGNHTSFDFNESTVAGFQRLLPPIGNRAFSTPCHNLSRVQPLSLSSYKPLDFADAEDTGSRPVVISAPEIKIEVVETQNLGKDVGLSSADTISKNAVVEQKLSTITETSREYVSSSSGSNSTGTTATSGGNTRQRLLSGASGVATMPSISESDVVRNRLAFSTPFSDGGLGNMPTGASGERLGDGETRFRGTPYYEKGLVGNSGIQKSSAIRKLLLADENERQPQDGANAENGAVVESVNPWTSAFVNYQLSRARRFDTYPNYHTFDEKLPTMKAGHAVCLGGETYLIIGVAGEGAYAQVFRCHLENEDSSEFILKVQRPCCPIEFYICQELCHRLKVSNLLDAIEPGLTLFRDAYMFTDGSVLVGDYAPYGTLLDLVNLYRQISSEKSPPEVIVAYLTADILRILEAVHGQKIIHGDVKPDNFLVLGTPALDLGGIPSKLRSVRLIDWGRSIDMALVPPSLTFSGKSNTSGFICCEMQDGRPWTYQTDYYGMLGTVHLLAFGEYMNVHKVNSTNRWRINKTFKRRWDDRIWREFFDTFLNVPDCQSLPSLSEWRKRFDDFVSVSRSTRPSTWTEELKKMQDILVELERSLAKRKKFI